MSEFVVSGTIHPQAIVEAFGQTQIGVTESKVGEGGLDDGRFQNIQTPWARNTATAQQHIYLRQLVGAARKRGANFIEFWGWPEVRHRDDGTCMVFSRLRMVQITVVPQGRPH